MYSILHTLNVAFVYMFNFSFKSMKMWFDCWKTEEKTFYSSKFKWTNMNLSGTTRQMLRYKVICKNPFYLSTKCLFQKYLFSFDKPLKKINFPNTLMWLMWIIDHIWFPHCAATNNTHLYTDPSPQEHPGAFESQFKTERPIVTPFSAVSIPSFRWATAAPSTWSADPSFVTRRTSRMWRGQVDAGGRCWVPLPVPVPSLLWVVPRLQDHCVIVSQL